MSVRSRRGTRTVTGAMLGALACSLAGCDDGPSEPASLAHECTRARVSMTTGLRTQTVVEVFDAHGQRVEARLQIAENDWRDATLTAAFDTEGRLVHTATSTAGPLGGAFTRDFVYDAAGRLARMELKGEVTEFWARRLDLQYTGANTEPTSVVVETGYERLVDTLTLDDAGRVTARLRVSTSTIPGAAPTRTRDTFIYADDELREVHTDWGDDDAIDAVYRIERDAAGRVVRAGAFKPDGAWIEGNVYDWVDGRVRELRWESTLDGLERFVFAYDDAGRLEAVTKSYGDDPGSYRLELRGGLPAAACNRTVGDALALPLDRFYADPAAPYLYGLPGLDLP